MKKRYFLYIYLLLFFILVLAISAEAKPRLSVRAFEDHTEDGNAPAGAIMDMMVTELDKAGIFSLIEREQLKYIADELRLAQSGLMDSETAPQLGKIKGAQYMMTGAITVYYYNEKKNGFSIIVGSTVEAKTAYVTLDLRIIDTTTSEVVYSAVQQGQSKQLSKQSGLEFSEFWAGSRNKTYGGILASATRDAVIKHVSAIKKHNWE